MKSQKYIIPGDPVPLARPRFGHGKVWDAQKAQKFSWGLQLSNQHGTLPLFNGPVQLQVDFFFPIPKTSKKRAESLCNTYHIYRPDLSNLIKYIEDVAQSILYNDDCIIASINASKRYDIHPRTELTIIQLENNESVKKD